LQKHLDHSFDETYLEQVETTTVVYNRYNRIPTATAFF